MKFVRRAGWVVLILFVLFLATLLGSYLPFTAKVRITGTEVKRVEVDPNDSSNETRDVRFVVTKDTVSGKTRVFRNEDTGWGWPPYFKFNSGDVMGEAVNIRETEPDSIVLLTYYGWRMPFFDAYPNILSLRVVDANYRHIPVFNIVFVSLLIAAFVFLGFRIRRLAKSVSNRFGGGPAGKGPA